MNSEIWPAMGMHEDQAKPKVAVCGCKGGWCSSFGSVVLGEFEVNLSKCTAEGDRCLCSSLQGRKKRHTASPLSSSTLQPTLLCVKVWL